MPSGNREETPASPAAAALGAAGWLGGGVARVRAGAALSYLSHMETAASSAHPRITLDPNICHGQPTVRGLRYPVQNVLEYLASGMTEAEILADYTDLEAEDLRACQAYAVSV